MLNSKTWNIIYIYTVDNEYFSGFFKIGQTSIKAVNDNWRQIDQQTIDNAAIARIKQINQTAGISGIHLITARIAIRTKNGIGEAYRDKDFHDALIQNGVTKEIPLNSKNLKLNNSINKDLKKIITTNGNEWFKVSEELLKNYLNEYTEGKLQFSNTIPKIILREPQQLAVEQLTIAWKQELKNNELEKCFLIDAIMRFGKCITSYAFINNNNIKKTLILTHRPVVRTSWYDDFKAFFCNENDKETKNKNYSFLSKDSIEQFEEFQNNYNKENENIIFFASIQDLRGQKKVNYSEVLDEDEFEDITNKENINELELMEWKAKNQAIFDTNWDVVIFDEAHEGLLTDLASKMNEHLHKNFCIYLSGTPFNIKTRDDFEKKFGNNIFIYDQMQESEYKECWDKKHGTDPNPYADLPNISLNGVHISKDNLLTATQETGYKNNYFNFNLFFELDEDNKFKDEEKIKQWLKNITSDEDDTFLAQMPYHKNNRFQTLHSLWVLPFDVKKANALEALLKDKDSWFAKQGYQIFNVAGGNYTKDNFKEIIQYTNDENKCSITLTIGRLTQGVTVPGWTSVLMLENTSSPMKYFQAIYRAKSPSPKHWITKKEYALIYDFNPDRMLDQIYQIYQNINSTKKITLDSEKNENILKVLNYYNVMCFSENGFDRLDINKWNEMLNRIITNKVVQNGFRATELIDKTKINNNINLNDEKIKKIVENLIAKSGKSNLKEKDEQKLTDNSLDVAIVETNHETGLTDKDIDDKISKEKDYRKNFLKIKTAINKIMTRVPYMLIGQSDAIMKEYKNGLESLNTDKFCSFFDDNDWKDIMQTFEKKEFKEVIKCFIDEKLFNMACEKSIAKINDISKIDDPLLRQKQWVELFNSIHNPDSETVLTPWKVVDLQYQINDINWSDSLSKRQKFIDINSKSAFYPLYAAIKLYESQNIKNNNKWREIIFNNIYIICKTNLSMNVAKRLLNYKEDDNNVIVYDFVEKFDILKKKNNSNFIDIIEDVMKKFKLPDLQKFDYCICNPPYQYSISSEKNVDNKSSANVIYDQFVMLGDQIADISCMIFPAKWMTGGKGLNNFRKYILNSKHIKNLIDCPQYNQLFPTITLHSGLSIMTIDNKSEHKSTSISTLDNFKITNTRKLKLSEYESLDVLIIDSFQREILQLIEQKYDIHSDKSKWLTITTLDKIISARKPFGISSDFYKNSDFLEKNQSGETSKYNKLKIYYIAIKKEHKNKNSIGNRTYCYIPENLILKSKEWINKWKVCIPISGGGDRNDKIILSKTFIAGPNEIVSESYRVCKMFDNEKEAITYSYYLESRFLRFLVSIVKLTQNAPRSVYKFVPDLDVIDTFKNWQTNITYEEKINALDKEIMRYFNFNESQIKHIFNKISIHNKKNELEDIVINDDE